MEELEQQPLVTNPEITKFKQKRAGLVSELNRLKSELAHHVLEEGGKRRKRRTPVRSQTEVVASTSVAPAILEDQLWSRQLTIS